MNGPLELYGQASRLLALGNPVEKCSGVIDLANAVAADRFLLDESVPVPRVDQPGRPRRPELLDPSRVPRRRLGTEEGRVALVHAIAHIEFNAINLALDAVCRFHRMPRAYYRDWFSVAVDEARHFTMLNNRLAEMNAAYGDLPAHNGLWEMAEQTADSCIVRMALVPRVLEARGLDVTPSMMDRLLKVGDSDTVSVLEVILSEEVGHVGIGTRWFRFACKAENRDPETAFHEILRERYRGVIRGPFNTEARYRAGFSRDEMALLEAAQQDPGPREFHD